MNTKELLSAFQANVAPTSLTPMGIQVASARACTIVDTHGNEHLDLLAGIGVAALGHGDPRVLAAIEEQARRHLHVMVYGEQTTDVSYGRYPDGTGTADFLENPTPGAANQHHQP